MMWGLRNVGFRSFEGSTGLALGVPGPPYIGSKLVGWRLERIGPLVHVLSGVCQRCPL